MAEPTPAATAEDRPGTDSADDRRTSSGSMIFGHKVVKVRTPHSDSRHRYVLPGSKWRTWNKEFDGPRGD